MGRGVRNDARDEFGLPGYGLAKDKGNEEYRVTVDDRDKTSDKFKSNSMSPGRLTSYRGRFSGGL
jgi:hypothetical protein